MAYENKEGFGALFRNEKKEGNQPDYRGTFKGLDGVEYDIAGWLKDKKDGGKFLSLKVSHQRGDGPNQRSEPKDVSLDRDIVPF